MFLKYQYLSQCDSILFSANNKVHYAISMFPLTLSPLKKSASPMKADSILSTAAPYCEDRIIFFYREMNKKRTFCCVIFCN